MARGTMHSGKSPETRRRRNPPTHDTTTLYRDGEKRGPDLEAATGRDDWSEPLRAWWTTWQHAPQAQAFEATDWQRLVLLASIVESYLTRPSAAALSEIRLNEERLGATVVDRMRARMRVEDDDREPAPVVGIKSRDDVKARLSGDAK